MWTCSWSKRTSGALASTLVVVRVTLTVWPAPTPVWPICSSCTSPALLRVMRTVTRYTSVLLLVDVPCQSWSLVVGAVPLAARAVVLSRVEPQRLRKLASAKPDTKVVLVKPATFWVAT